MQNVDSVLTVEKRSKLTLTGVESVDAFSDGEILLTVGGKRVRIAGSKLKVVSFTSGSGNFSATGEIDRIVYGGAKGKLFARLFK